MIGHSVAILTSEPDGLIKAFSAVGSVLVVTYDRRAMAASVSKYAQVRRKVLTPLATAKGLDYDTEMLAPSSTEEGQVFGLVACGADLLLGLIDADGFPSMDRRTIKRGAKWVMKDASGEAGQLAAIFLAQAMALSMELLQRRSGDELSAREHHEFRDLIQRVYPLPAHALDQLDGLDDEYRVMDTHEVPERVRKGLSMGTGYHRALTEPGFSQFENVDDDAELVEAQERAAAAFLRTTANLYALQMTIGAERYAKLEPELLTWNSGGFDQLTQQAADLARWAAISEDWKRQAMRILTSEPAEQPPADEIAAYLRRRAAELLANPDRQMDDRVADLVQKYAYAHASTETDWNCVTDAAITGYLLRRAEEELAEHATITGHEAKQLREAAHPEPKEAIDAGARRLGEQLPTFFSRGESSWQSVQTWAHQQSLDRSRQRRAQAIEKDEPPQITGDDCDQAFSYGYALRAVETTIYGEDA